MKILTILILLSSLPVLLLGILQSWKGYRSNWWTQVPTSNLKFKIIKTSIDDSQFWRPIVEGTYNFGGNSYKLSRIQFGDCGESSEAEARKVINKYQTDLISVYVNPGNPLEHVLFPGIKARASLIILVGLVLCLLAGLVEMELHPVEGGWPAGL